ncbi:MAG: cell division protein FtsZ [Chitinophagaceae bacterium]|nr:MAG: cell division protein FtsZ [Chitinophagaceae bacterium]
MIQFDLPKEQSSIIKVIGVGGGGSNAVNHMFSQNIEEVNFIICNTDAQALAQSLVPNKVQLGPHLTQGLGAGANPSIGRQATEESLEEIKRILEVNTKMAFITAGMGGGTGTGGAPILAKICKDLGILTVGIVTTPFAYEGKKRIAQAEEGISLLKDHVDTLLVISNDKLRHQFGNLKMKEAFSRADNVLATAAKCITDVIYSTGQINVDFADVCTVMRNGGVAILGSAAAGGENRAHDAIENALNSPLLNDNDIRGAKWILININSAEGEHEHTMDEVEVIQDYLLSQAGEDTDVILGLGCDNSLGDKISITLIATGFEHKDPFPKVEVPVKQNKDDEKIVMKLEMPETIVEPVKQASQPDIVESNADAQTKTDETKISEATVPDSEMPSLKDMPHFVDLRSKNTVDNLELTPVFFEISSPDPKVEVVALNPEYQQPDTLPKPNLTAVPQQENKQSEIEDASNKSSPSSGSFLAKPSQIYVEDEPVQQSNSNEEPQPVQITFQEDEPVMEMQLVVKDSQKAAEEEPLEQTQSIRMFPVEEPAMQDETEELRRRAMERIAKLRKLSFNVDASDPNNEFESVPAYLRRNMDMRNQIADVESFYSNYTVKTDENNNTEISSLNTFLDGKKPD